MDESLQVDDSLAGPSLSHLDPSLASLVPTELPLAAPVAALPVSSHPMLTRTKAGIFKTRHSANLAFLGSSGLLSALLASTEPKGFKIAAKNPAWLAAMDEESCTRTTPSVFLYFSDFWVIIISSFELVVGILVFGAEKFVG
ncbi:hypothetical protein CMV_000875 [Castanea mollissima]|uniref:Uncharacterized protein n=1 Tax=Castanea mollissima TaxID=60419 RepID=A0A8J4W710_9ROSI|nr:hypothetical protein CMV_000875 [Castanea mollissima]